MEGKLVVLAVLEQQLFDIDFFYPELSKVLSGSGQIARSFVSGFSGLATPISEESLSFGYLDQSQSTTIWNQNLPFWRNTNHPFLVLWRKGYFISTEVQQILLNLGFGGKADVLASSVGY